MIWKYTPLYKALEWKIKVYFKQNESYDKIWRVYICKSDVKSAHEEKHGITSLTWQSWLTEQIYEQNLAYRVAY